MSPEKPTTPKPHPVGYIPEPTNPPSKKQTPRPTPKSFCEYKIQSLYSSFNRPIYHYFGFFSLFGTFTAIFSKVGLSVTNCIQVIFATHRSHFFLSYAVIKVEGRKAV